MMTQLISLCKKTPNIALLLSQSSVIYKCKLLIIKTTKALYFTLSYQRLKKSQFSYGH